VSHTIGLSITQPNGKAFDASYDSDSVLIGSGPSAVLRLEDPEVSSIHAVVKVTPEGVVTIIDLGSEAGTTVNGSAVTEPVQLKLGDRIGLGRVTIVLSASGAERMSPKAHVLASEDRTLENDVTAKNQVPEPLMHPAAAAVDLAPATSPAAAPFEKVSAHGKKDVLSTQVIRERKEPRDNHYEPVAGSNVVTAEQDLDLSVLRAPLADANRPTADQRVLEVQIRWGNEVLDEVHVSEPRDITVGTRTSKKADLNVEASLPVEFFTIASNGGGEASIVVPNGAQVGLRKSDGTITREAALQPTDAPFPAKAYRLSLHERIAFKYGTLTFVAQYVKGDARMGRGSAMDWYFPRIFAISALAHAFFVFAAFITPEGSGGLVDDLFKNQNRFAQMILKAQEKEKKAKKLDLSGMKAGGKAKGDEGKFGKKDKPKKDALASKAGAPRVDPNKREKDRKIALNAGLLGILKGAGASGAVSNVFGPGGLGTGINNAMGGLRGTEMGDAGGAGGLGTRGSGAGGGGNGLGIGGLGTHGRGSGSGYGNIDLGGRGKGTTRIVPGKTIIQGSLSKEEIGRVIRRNLARFKYCYEKQLNANPNLAGKVAVYFTIAPTGEVAQASVRETSMNDENVESCVIKVMRSLKFPKPRGGGIVVVTYPFVFAAT
jgi:TonB family protein